MAYWLSKLSAVQREADRINRRTRRPRRRARGDERPVGPRLVRGRGYARRRRRTVGAASVLTTLAVLAAAAWLVGRYILPEFL